jgi:hypothetical protein
MGLLAGQEHTINNGDAIAIKMHMFDTLVNHMTEHFRGRPYSSYSLKQMVRDRLRSIRIYDLYDVCNFNLNVDEIEKLCNSDYVYAVNTQKFIVAEYSASFVQTLENALHYYRKELDQIPVAIYKRKFFEDIDDSKIEKIITLQDYIDGLIDTHQQFMVSKYITGANVVFSNEFVEEAVEYVTNELC